MRTILCRLGAGAALAAALAVTLSTVRGVAETANLAATPEKPAALSIALPKTTNAFLDLWVRAYTPPKRGAVESVVSLGVAGGNDIEVGRFAVFPSEPFFAANPDQQRAYRFDATAALASLRAKGSTLIVRVRLVPTDPKMQSDGAQLTLSRAEFSPRS